MFASIKVSPYGVHSRSIFEFIGIFSRRKLIELFVELHYCMDPGGRPNEETWMAIQRYSDEIDEQKRQFKQRWGLNDNRGQSGGAGKEQGVSEKSV